jgi:hypothetical protein
MPVEMNAVISFSCKIVFQIMLLRNTGVVWAETQYLQSVGTSQNKHLSKFYIFCRFTFPVPNIPQAFGPIGLL